MKKELKGNKNREKCALVKGYGYYQIKSSWLLRPITSIVVNNNSHHRTN